jgi:hypothetical protein
MNRKRILSLTGLTLFIIGVLYGGLWLGSRIATHIGASAVNVVSDLGGEPMAHTCPTVLGISEIGTLRASVRNQTTEPITYSVSFSALKESGMQVLQKCNALLELLPSETQTARCRVSPDTAIDYVLGNHISIRAVALPVDDTGQSLVSQGKTLYEATCIIDVTPSPNRTGKQAIAGTLWLIMVMLLVGPVLWIAGTLPFNVWKIILLVVFMAVALGWIGVVFWYLAR